MLPDLVQVSCVPGLRCQRFFRISVHHCSPAWSQVFVLTVATKYPAFWVGMMGIISSDSLNVDLSQSRQL